MIHPVKFTIYHAVEILFDCWVPFHWQVHTRKMKSEISGPGCPATASSMRVDCHNHATVCHG